MQDEQQAQKVVPMEYADGKDTFLPPAEEIAWLQKFLVFANNDLHAFGYQLRAEPHEAFEAELYGNGHTTYLPMGYIFSITKVEQAASLKSIDSITLKTMLQSAFQAAGVESPAIERTSAGIWVAHDTVDALRMQELPRAVLDMLNPPDRSMVNQAFFQNFMQQFCAHMPFGRNIGC